MKGCTDAEVGCIWILNHSLFVLLLSILPLRCEDDGVGVDVDDDNNTEE